jgi:hypothetical protein
VIFGEVYVGCKLLVVIVSKSFELGSSLSYC